MYKFRYISIITLLVFAGAGFSVLDNLSLPFIKNASRLEAARRSKKSNKSNKSDKKSESKKDSNEKLNEDDSGFLADKDKARSYMPDIYRCPDCGYEQDEEGYCPDHATLELVKVISNPKDPMAPSELDGNEDILVDVHLNIVFKKDEIEAKKKDEKASEDSKNKSTNNKSSKKTKKSK